jgi:hypothetical protein
LRLFHWDASDLLPYETSRRAKLPEESKVYQPGRKRERPASIGFPARESENYRGCELIEVETE